MKKILNLAIAVTIATQASAFKNSLEIKKPTNVLQSSSFSTVNKAWGEFLERPSPWSYGGMFGLNFIKDGYVFNFQPFISYRAANRLFLGYSSGFSYVQQKIAYTKSNGEVLKDNYKGFYFDNSIFMRWFFHGLKFIQLEPGIVNFKNLEFFKYDPAANNLVLTYKWYQVPYVQVGGGFVVPLSGDNFIIIRAMYDVLQLENSPYKGLPVIRGGINIGI